MSNGIANVLLTPNEMAAMKGSSAYTLGAVCAYAGRSEDDIVSVDYGGGRPIHVCFGDKTVTLLGASLLVRGAPLPFNDPCLIVTHHPEKE